MYVQGTPLGNLSSYCLEYFILKFYLQKKKNTFFNEGQMIDFVK